MKEKLIIAAALIPLLLIMIAGVVVASDLPSYRTEREPDTCDKVTMGDFGPRLCGYNINAICFEPRGWQQIPPIETKICEKYFNLKGI